MTVRAIALWLAGLAALPAQERSLRAVALDTDADAEVRCRALADLQQAGALDVDTVLAAMGTEEDAVAATAAAIVRHEWFELSPELLQGLDRDGKAARRFLRELAWAPRPAAAVWSEAWIAPQPGRSFDDRCLGLAARGRPLVAADTALLLQALTDGDGDGDVGDGWRLAVGLLPAAVADGLIGRVHAMLQQQQIEVAQVAPLFDRMSLDGVRRLAGLASVLPEAVGDAICDQLLQRDPELVRERACAMLDGEVPMAARWLRRTEDLLDVPERRERLLAVLTATDASPALQQRAFEALLEVHVTDQRLVQWALANTGDRSANLHRLLDATVDRLPGSLLADWLVGDPALALATVRALGRRTELGDEIERELLARFEGAVAEGPYLQAAATALLQRGSAATVEVLWPQLRSSREWSEYVDTLARRQAPFVHQLLLLELEAPAPVDVSAAVRERQLDDVRLGLVAIGDLRQLRLLVDHAMRATPTFVRRCAHYARPLAKPFALQLLDGIATADIADDDLVAELVAWAASCRDDEVLARMQQIWNARAVDDRAVLLREVALRALVLGPQRGQLVATLRQAIADGPLPDELEPLPFEAIASMPEPPTAADVHLLAELALLPPLGDAAHERELAERWPDGRAGFPLLAAVGRRLLGCDADTVRAAFADVAASVVADPRRDALSRQRLLVLWRVLERDRALMQAVGGATAELCLQLPSTEATAAGPAHWFLLHEAAARGDHTAAARHARAAIGGLLRSADDRAAARLFLGERDPAAGRDPWAALACAPYRQDLLAALAADDAAAADRARVRIREFAGHDASARAGHDLPTAEDPIR